MKRKFSVSHDYSFRLFPKYRFRLAQNTLLLPIAVYASFAAFSSQKKRTFLFLVLST
jgi:hypothetical protein